VRALFTTIPGLGDFHPLRPLARALVVAGHEVAFACSPSFCPTIEADGFRCLPAGLDWSSPEAQAAFAPFAALPPGKEQTAWVWEHIFCGQPAERLASDLCALYPVERFDVVVRESNEFGGYLAADVLGVPHVSVAADPYGSAYPRRHIFAAHLAGIRARLGLAADPDGDALYRYLHLACFPPSFVTPGEPVAPTVHFLRRVLIDGNGDGAEELPAWFETLPPRPTVHATLGTVFHREPALVQAILDGLRDEPVNLIVAVGPDQDPAQYGAQPPSVRIERYLPHGQLLPRCDLVICHGGLNTVMAALSCGLPLVVIPLAADQPHNARRCVDLGVGTLIDPVAATPEAIRDAVRTVLADPRYQANARRLQAESEGLPGPEHGVALVERLVAQNGTQPEE
jgi:UDP:flavonoid glycosyltransferase YjiC (YdhE family)